ncbi:hypothetical protein HO133_009116 [Letharia lupina]|uniref:CCHC-type domain-containing protein n=1 Tax=Letharia lupina TaxID=560253 RepID=A0A8H6FFB9_9LECA|nr:uncharacterized protein HO133_009116 [Letharia lupina]KAF6226250.1 hypothetical protein HO133_009116 [Letharia lupina]
MDPGPWQYGNRQYSIKLSDTGVAGLQKSALDMSSLSRRACYKCGNVGHYAVGEGMQADIVQKYARHQNAYVTTDMNPMDARILAPPTGLGHVQADCPTLRISGAGTGGGRCYSCGQPGHLAVRTPASRIRSFSLTVIDSDLAQMQAFNPDLHSVQVGELFLPVADSPAVFAEALREVLVVHVLQHATSVVDQTTTLVTVRRKL